MRNIQPSCGESKAKLTPIAHAVRFAMRCGITSPADLAKELECTPSAVYRALKQLKDADRTVTDSDATVNSDRTELTVQSESDATVTKTDRAVTGASRVLDNNKLTSLEVTSVSEVKKDSCAIFHLPTNPRAKGTAPRQRGSRDEIDIAFEQWWQVYPAGRKRGKGKCRTIFNILASGAHHTYGYVAPETLIDAARRYTQTKPDPQFVPLPITWLNQGRWEDEPEANSQPAKPTWQASGTAKPKSRFSQILDEALANGAAQ